MHTKISEIHTIAKEADKVLLKPESCGSSDIEEHSRRIVRIASSHPDLRDDIIKAFRIILTDDDGGAWEVLLLVMHLLRWPEMKAWIDEQKETCIKRKDWRGEPVFRSLSEAFSEDWDDRDLYQMFREKDEQVETPNSFQAGA